MAQHPTGTDFSGRRATAESLRLGSRGSALAMTQARGVAALLARSRARLDCEIVVISSLGDREAQAPLASLGAQGIFTRALERALEDGTIDVAVHSAKDLPSSLPDGYAIGAIPKREDARDCLVTRQGLSLDQLPRGALVGTGSTRRVAQLRRVRPDLVFVAIRGNVDTRRNAALAGKVDAVVLAAAGLLRLGLFDEHVHPLSEALCLPQAGQGALAVESLAADRRIVDAIRAIDDDPSHACVQAERAVLANLAAGCQAPVAAYAELVDAATIRLQAFVATPDGAGLREEISGPERDPAALGMRLATALSAKGADEALSSFRARSADA